MNRLFSLTHTVRYDECNCDGFLTPTAFLRYMQDIAARDAEDAHLSGNGYWIIKRTFISFLAPISTHTRLELRTFGIGFSRITAQRGYEAYLAETGQKVVSAHSLWVYVDRNGRPTRLPAETADVWLPDGNQIPQSQAPFPGLPAAEPEIIAAQVQFSDIDLARHLNNAASVELLENASWQVYAQYGLSPDTITLHPHSCDIEYVDSPRFGDDLVIQNWLSPLPTIGEECERLQRITRDGKLMVRAHSRWQCEAK